MGRTRLQRSVAAECPPGYILPRAAAERLGVSYATVLTWCSQGVLDAVERHHGRMVYWYVSADVQTTDVACPRCSGTGTLRRPIPTETR